MEKIKQGEIPMKTRKADHEHKFFNVYPGAEQNMCACGVYEPRPDQTARHTPAAQDPTQAWRDRHNPNKPAVQDVLAKRIYLDDWDYVRHINDLRDEVEGLRPSHAELLEALKQAHKILLEHDIIMTGNDALIKKAEGK
jgi:hypothetical protein